MWSEGRVTQSTDRNVGDGSIQAVTLGRSGEMLVADARARYYDAVKRGNVYKACMQAIGALSVNSTTATGLILTNPTTSTKNFVIWRLRVALASAPAGISVLALVGKASGSSLSVTHTTPMTTGFSNALYGAANNSVALVDTAATIPTPETIHPVGGGPVATGSVTSPFINDEFGGDLIMYPGSVISLQCFTTAISVIASLVWEEVPAA